MASVKRIRDFRVLTFDTFGTLIDWETGIWNALAPLRDRLSRPVDRETALEAFARHETALEATAPDRLYRHLLAEVYGRMSAEWGAKAEPDESAAFGESVPDWPAFPDAAEGLARLREHFCLATLTNCDRRSYRGASARLGDPWDAVWTAEDIGSYKPDRRNFEHLIRSVQSVFSATPEDVLHIAQSLHHDIVPAARYGLPYTAWINRRQDEPGSGATLPTAGEVKPNWQFASLAEFVEHLQAERA